MLKRTAEIRRERSRTNGGLMSTGTALGTQSSNNPTQFVSSEPGVRYAPLDPDSYAYFHRYYLYPRAVAAAQRRLGLLPYGVYSPSGPPVSYGHPWAFGP